MIELALFGSPEGLLLFTSIEVLMTRILNGFVLGMTLVLIAIGLTIIFGVLGIVNFAHGDILLVGTYTGWYVATTTGSYVAGMLGALLAVGILGFFIEYLALRPIYDYNILLQLLLTFGIAELLRGSIEFTFGSLERSFPVPAFARWQVDFGLFQYPAYRLFVIVVAAIIVVVTYLFLRRTDIGMIIRAGTEDREMVGVVGINISKAFTLVFVIGAAIAGIAGALIAPIQGVHPTLGVDLLVPAFVVVVIGGMGSLRGSLVAGILVGQMITLTGLVYPPASDVIIYVFMAIVLLIRPRGLFGREGVLEA